MARAVPRYTGRQSTIDDTDSLADLKRRNEIEKEVKAAILAVIGNGRIVRGANHRKALIDELKSGAMTMYCELQIATTAPSWIDIEAEHRDLVQTMGDLASKLRTLSPQYEQLLPVAFDPHELADHVNTARNQVVHGIAAVRKRLTPAQFTGQRIVQRQHAIARHLAQLVASALQEHSVRATTTTHATRVADSVALDLLEGIGGAIGLWRGRASWRNLLSRVRA